MLKHTPDPSFFLEAEGHTVSVPGFRESLVDWGAGHIRTFPWRLTTDPYRILMAEVMLHRTQVQQVVRVYERFMEQYPNLEILADAPPDEIRQVLRPLGLTWRIDHVIEMINVLTQTFHSLIPEGREELISLPGVSDYIASAVRCFAWGRREALLDTNTIRVIGRVFGLIIKPSSRRNRVYRDLITALVDPFRPRTYNYALLDLAHLICHKRKEPECIICPLQSQCSYGSGKLRGEKRNS